MMPKWDYVLHSRNPHIHENESLGCHELQFALEKGGQPEIITVFHYGDGPPIDTPNQRDYYEAIWSVDAFLTQLDIRSINPYSLKVQICTSQLVANQVMGKWQVNDSTLFMLCAKLRALLSEFGEWEAIYE
jgi:hypothetical protein